MKNWIAKKLGLYILCFVLMVLIVKFPLQVFAADTIKIGLLEPFSGTFEAYGRGWLSAVQFAVDDQNAKGGLFGKKVEIIKEDDELKPDVATRKAKKLILEDKVNFLTSGMGSHIGIAMNKVATNNNIIYINYAAYADEIQGKEFSRYGFRVGQNDYSAYAALAMAMINKPYRKIYGLYPDYAAGYSKEKAFKEHLKRNIPDAVIVGTDFHPLGARDFGPYITKIIASKADAVVAGNFGADLINFIKQARSMGLKSPFPILAPLGVHPYTLNELKDDMVGVYFTYNYSLQVKTPENEDLIKRWHEKHKNDKDFLTWWPFTDIGTSILGWKMTFAALEKANSLDTEKIIDTFEGFQWKSPVGLWTMRKCDHQLICPMFGGVIEAGTNPFFNGSIRSDVKFPWVGPKIEEFPAEKVAIPATRDYNGRCQ
jgi:branched-chain amino acid transport system substrate-binding protein